MFGLFQIRKHSSCFLVSVSRCVPRDKTKRFSRPRPTATVIISWNTRLTPRVTHVPLQCCVHSSVKFNIEGGRGKERRVSRVGAVVEHLPLTQASPRHMWVELVVGSCPCSERFFSGYSDFPLSSKTNTSKFQFDLESLRAHLIWSLALLCVPHHHGESDR